MEEILLPGEEGGWEFGKEHRGFWENGGEPVIANRI